MEADSFDNLLKTVINVTDPNLLFHVMRPFVKNFNHCECGKFAYIYSKVNWRK
jgi:hypothetical protein